MQSSPNILRNSYGYQMQEPPVLRSPNSKVYNTSTHQFNINQPQFIPNSIKTFQNKLEGIEGLVKKKNTQVEAYQPIQKVETSDNRPKNLFANYPPEEPLSEHQLRGSCQNIIKKFDYSNLRNTTHFNLMNKFSNHNEIRRSPGAEDQGQKNALVNKTLVQEPANTFLKPNQKKILQNKHSFLANNQSRTPPKLFAQKTAEEKCLQGSKTPTKYKSLFDNSTKTSASYKSIPENQQKKQFKTLNQIAESKHKEKSPEVGKSMCKKSKIINSFEIGNLLGKGKFGEVYLARHHETGFIAAIKKTQKQKVKQFKMVDQYTKEIRLHSCLDHPNIVKFYGVFEQHEDIYLVMEYLNGGTLFDYLNQVNCLNVKEAVDYLKDIIEALTYMHSKSIAHRDIKPENIVISSEGVAKLCDFGWSAVVETSRKTYCGTFDYAPPEILQRKNYDTSVDIWCIGVLTYELLTGRVPFEGDKRNVVMQKIVNIDKNKIDYPSQVPPQAREFIECLVQKDPALRPKCQDLLKFRLFTMHASKGMKAKKIT